MYPHFIEVHNDGTFSVNVSQIVWFDDGVIQTEERELCCDESYEEIKALVRDAGCHIEKGDPRLDLSRPLNMDDLRDMVGEPVWNSNTLRWELLCSYDDDGPGFITETGTTFYRTEHDLIAKPLYRMKVTK